MGHSVADGEGRLLALDPTVCEMLQREERELIGLRYADVTHPDDRVRNVQLVERLTIHDGPLRLRKRYIRPNGSTIWCDVQVSRFDAGRDVGRLVGSIQAAAPETIERGPESLWRSARRVHALVQRRRVELGDDLFSDHAWVILLQVYLAEAEGRIVDVTSIGERANIRPATVARWLRALEDKGLLDRPEWAGHASQLTASGIASVEALLDRTVTT